jgi:hypothetical protein
MSANWIYPTYHHHYDKELTEWNDKILSLVIITLTSAENPLKQQINEADVPFKARMFNLFDKFEDD